MKYKENKIIALQQEVNRLKDENYKIQEELDRVNRVNEELSSHNKMLENEISNTAKEAKIPIKEFYTFDGEKRISLWLSNGQKVQVDITAKSLNELANKVLQAKVNNVSFMNTYKVSSRYLDDTSRVVIWSNDVVSIFIDSEEDE